MNLISISWKNIIAKPLSTALNIVLLSLGVSIILVLLLLSNQIEEKLTRNSDGIDLVVGAKGSPMQLILASIYHIDYPTGNIYLKDAKKLAMNRLVRKVIPLAMGDSYQGFRIIGSSHDYPDWYKATLNDGKIWKNNYEVVLGYNAAKKTGIKIGDKFVGSHGITAGEMSHEEHPFLVTGVFEKSNTVVDNLILTSIESVWGIHGHEEEHGKSMSIPVSQKESAIDGNSKEQLLMNHHDSHEHPEALPSADANLLKVAADSLRRIKSILAKKGTFPEGDDDKEITSMLIQYSSPMGIIQMPRFINTTTSMQAASPSFEVTRLFSLIGVGASMIQGFAYLIIFIAALSIFIGLYNSLKERKYDLALMRSMGASQQILFLGILVEGLLVVLVGCLIGFVLAHGILEIIGIVYQKTSDAGLTGFLFLQDELYIFAGCMVLGVLASLIPAITAYKTDISKVLAKGE